MEAVEKWRATLTEKQRFEWASPDAIIRHCPVFNRPPAADANRKPSAYAKLEQTNDDLARELDAAKAYIAELEAAQPDQGSPQAWRRDSGRGRHNLNRSHEILGDPQDLWSRITAVLADFRGHRRRALYPYCEAGHAAAWRSPSPIRSPQFRRSSRDDLRGRRRCAG